MYRNATYIQYICFKNVKIIEIFFFDNENLEKIVFAIFSLLFFLSV